LNPGKKAWQDRRVQGQMAPGDSGTVAAAPLRAIVIYKSVKAAVQLAIAVLLVAAWPLGLPERLLHLAGWLRHHITQGWAAHLAEWIAAGSTSRRILLSIAALGLDGVLTAVEAWALHTGRSWGSWLVVGTTGALLPVEVYEFVRVPRWSRALIFALNLLILWYLARRAWREARHGEARHGEARHGEARHGEARHGAP
jgi:uncharacterized membrane protein (DUF2068 family)